MSDLISILQALKGWTPLATVFGVILISHYFRVWLWWKDHLDTTHRLTRELEEAKEEREKMVRVAFRAVGLAEDTFVIAKRKVPTDVP